MTTLNPNINAMARFHIGEAGQFTPIDGTGSVPGTATDLITRRAGAGTITIVSDPSAVSFTSPPMPISLNDFLALTKAIAIPQPPAGLPFSQLSSAYVVSWQSLAGAAPGSVTPQAFVELVSPGAPGRGMNY